MAVTFRVLGDLEIGDGEARLALPGGHARTVLAALLVNANRQLSPAELLMVAWGHTDVDPTQLHKGIAEIRKLMDKVGRRDKLRTHRAAGYELRLATDELDSLQFHQHVLRADEAKTTRRTDDEIAHLRAALDLWRGQHAVANVPGDGLRAMTRDLEQRRRRVALRLFELELGRGNHVEVVAQLAVLAGYYPTDRRLCELFMLAQYRGGHGAEAADTFEAYRQTLADSTGAEPEADLRDLHYAIARGDDAAVGRFEAVLIAPVGAVERFVVAVPRQLPPDPADFVGRDEQIAEALWLLDRDPGPLEQVLVISGPGGMGKTAMSLHIAHRVAAHYPGGQLFAELRANAGAPVPTEEVLAGFLRAFGVSHVPESRTERASLYRTIVAERRVLVVLDDVRDEEHVRDLVPGNQACAVVMTARRPLPDIDGAHHVQRLDALEPPTATALFNRIVTRSRLAAPTGSPDFERVVELCAGLPLALRVAAALYVRDHPRPLAELADRLAEQGADGFTYGPRSVVRTIGASYERLDGPAQRLFLGLAVTRLPEFERWTAMALLATDAATATLAAEAGGALAQLAQRHVVDPVGTSQRYRFHDLTRDYARRLADTQLPDVDAVARRAYRALLTLARRAHRRLIGGDFELVHSSVPDEPGLPDEDGASPLDWFERERSNLRAAVEHCAELGLADVAWDLALTAHEFYAIAGYFDDWHATHLVALGACQAAGDRRGEAILLTSLGQPSLVASRRAGQVSGPAELERAIDLLVRLGDEHGAAIARRTLANALRRRGQLAHPLQLFIEAQDGYERSGDALGSWQTLRFIGQTHLDRGDAAQALRLLIQALPAAEALSSPYAVVQTMYWTGQAHLALHNLAEADAAFTMVRTLSPGPKTVAYAYALHGLGDVARRSGDLMMAADRLGEAGRIAHDAADGTLEGRVHLSLAALHEAGGRPDARCASLEHAVDCFAGADAVYLESVALAALGAAEADRGDADAAAAAWTRVDDLYAAMALPAEDRILRPPSPSR
jgi:DNA-binding SARP family transcriptional activator/tetratricopeptide (TPR) repeat protein